MKRRIYFRVTPGQISGSYHDLKTLKGATARLMKRCPNWQEIEVQFDHPVGHPVISNTVDSEKVAR